MSMNTANPTAPAETRVEAMQRLCWEAFSARYQQAQKEELERFPKLQAAWEEWQSAWCAGIEAHISLLGQP